MVVLLLSSLTLTSCYKKYDPKDGAPFEKTWNCTSTTGTGVSKVFAMSNGGSGVKVKCNTTIGYGGCSQLVDLNGEANSSRISFSTQTKDDACGYHEMVSLSGTLWKGVLTLQQSEYRYRDTSYVKDAVDHTDRIIETTNTDEFTCTY